MQLSCKLKKKSLKQGKTLISPIPTPVELGFYLKVTPDLRYRPWKIYLDIDRNTSKRRLNEECDLLGSMPYIWTLMNTRVLNSLNTEGELPCLRATWDMKFNSMLVKTFKLVTDKGEQRNFRLTGKVRSNLVWVELLSGLGKPLNLYSEPLMSSWSITLQP